MIGCKSRLVAMLTTTTTSIGDGGKRTKSHSRGADDSNATPKAVRLITINEMTTAAELATTTLAEIAADTVMEQILAAIGKDATPPQQRSSLPLGKLEDRVMVVEVGEVCITSTVASSTYVSR